MTAPTCNFQQKHCSKGAFPTLQCPALSIPSSPPVSHCQTGTSSGRQRALPPPHSWEKGGLLRSLKSLFFRLWQEARGGGEGPVHGAMGSFPAPSTFLEWVRTDECKGPCSGSLPAHRPPGCPGPHHSPGWQGTATHPTAAGGDGCFARRNRDCGWVHVLCGCVGEAHA